MESEDWRAIKGLEGRYEVSDMGRVRSLDRIVPRDGYPFRSKGRVLKITLDGDGYPKVTMGRGCQRKIHRLVAEAFIPNPENLPEVDREDTDKLNCRKENLRWCTKQQNSRYRHDKTHVTCETTIGPTVRRAIKAAILSGRPVLHVSREFNVSRSHVRRIAAAPTGVPT